MLAATMAAETMAVAGGKAPSDMKKLRSDVLEQAIASLASFMGGVNYSDSFHMAAAAQKGKARIAERGSSGMSVEPEPESKGKCTGNPLYDAERMTISVEHANSTTSSYGVQIVDQHSLCCAHRQGAHQGLGLRSGGQCSSIAG